MIRNSVGYRGLTVLEADGHCNAAGPFRGMTLPRVGMAQLPKPNSHISSVGHRACRQCRSLSDLAKTLVLETPNVNGPPKAPTARLATPHHGLLDHRERWPVANGKTPRALANEHQWP
jgi:hypothetical protein